MGKILSALSSLASAITKTNPTSVLILAAGSSERFSGGEGEKKQFIEVGGIPAVLRSAAAFDACEDVVEIIVVTGEDDIERCRELLDCKIGKLTHVTAGGDTRLYSAKAGLDLVDPKSKYIAVHDAARCLVTPEMIKKVLAEAVRSGAAAAAVPSSDTVKESDGFTTVRKTLDRDRIWLAATPQIFNANEYRASLYTAVRDGASVTDDCAMAERLGFKVRLVDCGRENIKITYPVDAAVAEAILSWREKRGSDEHGGGAG